MPNDINTIFCGNLADRVTEEILYELFLQAGPLKDVRIPVTNGKRKNFGFIEYKHEVSVPYALALLEDTTLFGRRLTIRGPEGVKPYIPDPLLCPGVHEGLSPRDKRRRDSREDSPRPAKSGKFYHYDNRDFRRNGIRTDDSWRKRDDYGGDFRSRGDYRRDFQDDFRPREDHRRNDDYRDDLYPRNDQRGHGRQSFRSRGEHDSRNKRRDDYRNRRNHRHREYEQSPRHREISYRH